MNGSGGAINNDRSNQLTLIYSRFTGNTSGSSGGAINYHNEFSGALDVVSCEFRDNSASVDGGGVYARKSVAARFDNCLFSQNVAANGAGLYLFNVTDTTVTNGSFVYNTATTGTGGGLRQDGQTLAVENSILWGNTDAVSSIQDAQLNVNGGTTTVERSCVQDDSPMPPVIAGTGNIDEAPLFVDSMNDDYRLLSGSPCIDTGDNLLLSSDYGDLDDDTDVGEMTPRDVVLATRIVNGTSTIDDLTSCDGIVDMGAYEYRYNCEVCVLGDVNVDGKVDGDDVQPFVACLLGGSGCGCACGDVRGRNGVGIEDIACFVSLVLSGGEESECASDYCDFIPAGCPDSVVLLLQLGETPDCNDNLIPDVCEIDENSTAPGGPFYCQANCQPDVNNDGIPYECQGDCNGNGIPDDKDIADATSSDCNANGIPDECGIEPDCNANGIPDDCDIANQTSDDCDSNGVPDECDQDCDDDGTPDACETLIDCNSNGIFDACEMDCDEDGIPDECELSGNDCNQNGLPDDCEVNRDPPWNLPDCNNNDVPDECELSGNDCNGNTIPDECDIATGLSQDTNSNGIPDECESQQQSQSGGGGSGMSMAGASSAPASGLAFGLSEAEAWAAYFAWCSETDFSGMDNAGVFSALLNKRLELGLPAEQMLPE